MPSLIKETKALLKSPGGWFFASNAILYTQTRPTIALFFLAALVGQRACSHASGQLPKNGFLKLVAGHQGILAVNAIMTLGSAFVTLLVGNVVLASSGFAFGLANLIQAIVYSGALTSLDEQHNINRRHLVLAGCEFAIALGLALIAINAGYSAKISFGLIIPVVIAGILRSFRPHWLPSGFAYADMMILSLMTGYEAILTGNWANAFSRLIVLFGLTRLAVLRAQHDGKRSIFEVERFVDGLLERRRKTRKNNRSSR